MSRKRSRTVKGLVSASAGLGLVSSRMKFPMSRSRLDLEAERLGPRLGLGQKGLVSIPGLKSLAFLDKTV
jgi:hypothetical protein